jgi:Protein of unknown function (DUF3987)
VSRHSKCLESATPAKPNFKRKPPQNDKFGGGKNENQQMKTTIDTEPVNGFEEPSPLEKPRGFHPVAEPGEDEDICDHQYLGAEIFDNRLSEMVQTASDVSGSPESVCTMLALAAVSAAIGKGARVTFGQDPMSLGLYFLNFIQSGSGKSRAFKTMLKPIVDLQIAENTEWEKEVRPKAEAEARVIDAKINGCRRAIENRKASSETESELVDLYVSKDALQWKLTRPISYTEDSTIQSIAVLMAENNEQLSFISSDAGAAIQNLLGRYNKDSQPDDTLFVKSYSEEPFTQTRIGREAIMLKSTWASLLWMAQPDKWDHLVKSEWLMDGGFIARCLLSRVEGDIRDNDGEERAVPGSLEQEYAKWIEEIFHAYRDLARNCDAPLIIRATPNARELMRDFENGEVNVHRRDHPEFGPFSARWVENAIRLAGVLHVARHGARSHHEEIDYTTASEAIKVMRWFMERQLRLLGDVYNKKATERLHRLFEKVSNSTHGSGDIKIIGAITLRQLKRSGWTEPYIRSMVGRYGDKLKISTQETGGRPTEIVEWTEKNIRIPENPALN